MKPNSCARTRSEVILDAVDVRQAVAEGLIGPNDARELAARSDEEPRMSQLSLLKRRGFAALFWTQFLGAFNDNLFKNALVILIAYRSLSLFGLSAGDLVVLSGGIFILPFFFFSATAGQLADKLPKPPLVRWVKA